MDKPISVGDLVMLVRWPHKCELQHPKIIFVVHSFDTFAECFGCGERIEQQIAMTGHTGTAEGGRAFRVGYPVSWLKRIEPLTDEERFRAAMDDAFDVLFETYDARDAIR